MSTYEAANKKFLKDINSSVKSKDMADSRKDILKGHEEIIKFSEQGMTNAVHNDKSCVFCEHCNNHHFSYQASNKHLLSERHVYHFKLEEKKNAISKLKQPSSAHADAIETELEKLVVDVGLSVEEKQKRKSVFLSFQSYIHKTLPDIQLKMYGSSVSGTAFKSSDLNICVSGPKNPTVLTEIKNILENEDSGLVGDIMCDFNATTPFLCFKYEHIEINLVFDTFWPYFTSQLLRLYKNTDEKFVKLAIGFRYLAKLTQMDKPELGTLPSYTFDLLTIYFLQNCKPAVLPVYETEEAESVNPDQVALLFRKFETQKEYWRSNNIESLGSLFVSMLRYYCVDFNFGNRFVQIRSKAIIKPNEIKWANKKMNVEDPFIRNTNVARTIPHFSICDYINDQLQVLYIYFAKPHFKSNISRKAQKKHRDTLDSDEDILVEDLEDISLSDSDQDEYTKEDYYVNFNIKEISGRKGPEKFCSLCQKKGHMKDSCPDQILPPLKSLPQWTEIHHQMVAQALIAIRNEIQPTLPQSRKRDTEIIKLQDFIQTKYPGAVLRLFGSSINGFGFWNSDLDISLSVREFPDGFESNSQKEPYVKGLAKHLRSNSALSEIHPIVHARVPIVKMRFKNLEVEGDISMENRLGLQNSLLLWSYCQIDDRVSILGYAMKVFAKVCDICDASRGSLSSYAYTLMTIYFLQQTKPPVLPVLQELYTGTEKPTDMVNEHNTWFFKDLKNLSSVWPGYRQNKKTAAQLWLGLLRFYTEEFQVGKHVVAIKQLQPLTRFEKLWNGKTFAIEDPFDLTHNLGKTLSMSMQKYTMMVLRNGRTRFGVPFAQPINDPVNYFLDVDYLIEGNRPVGRGCNACGKVDHRVADCPNIKKNRKKQFEENRQQQKPERTQQNVRRGRDQQYPTHFNQPDYYNYPQDKQNYRGPSNYNRSNQGRGHYPNNSHHGQNRRKQEPNRNSNAPNRNSNAPNRNSNAPNRISNAPNRISNAPNRISNAPNRNSNAPQQPLMTMPFAPVMVMPPYQRAPLSMVSTSDSFYGQQVDNIRYPGSPQPIQPFSLRTLHNQHNATRQGHTPDWDPLNFSSGSSRSSSESNSNTPPNLTQINNYMGRQHNP